MGVPATKKDSKEQTALETKHEGQLTDQPAGELKHEIKGKKIKHGDNEEPDSWLAQKYANEQVINTEIVKAVQTKDYAEVITRAINPLTGQYVEDIIHHDFDTIFMKKAIELIDKTLKKAPKGQKKTVFIEDLKNPLILTDDDKLIPNFTNRGKMKMAKEMINFKNFALRDATTKSMRRAQLKIVNKDWKESEEKIEEIMEREVVQEMIKEQQRGRVTSPKPRKTMKNEYVKPEEEVQQEKEKETEYIPPGEKSKAEEEKLLKERKEEIKNIDKDKENEKEKTGKGQTEERDETNKTKESKLQKEINEKTKDLPDDELKIDVCLSTIRETLREEGQEYSALNVLRKADKAFNEERITLEQFKRMKERIKDGSFDY